MGIDPDDGLIQAVHDALSELTDPVVKNPIAASDLYELFLLTAAIRAAHREGGDVTLTNISGSAPTELYFRSSPGHIYSTLKPYTYAILDFPNARPLEAHLGIMVMGKSLVQHESDLAILPQSEADTCRNDNMVPRSSQLLISVEAKYYGTALPLNMARAFLGLSTDLSTKNVCFVANTTSPSVARLLAHDRRREWQDDVLPNSRGSERLEAFFRDAYHRYQASQ